jgi:hypothetical protein
VGNAVPPPLAKVIASSIQEQMQGAPVMLKRGHLALPLAPVGS